jgi:hypothetical protein
MSISSHTFRAFRSRNYRLFFGGQSVSVIGTWMQRTAVSWVVYTLTHNALMLGLTDLPNALAFNSSMNNMARLVGPALSGIILQRYGAGVCFLLNAFSFVAVIASLLLMQLPPHIPPPVKKKVMTDMAEGFTYLRNTPAIGRIMLMLTLMSLLLVSPGDGVRGGVWVRHHVPDVDLQHHHPAGVGQTDARPGDWLFGHVGVRNAAPGQPACRRIIQTHRRTPQLAGAGMYRAGYCLDFLKFSYTQQKTTQTCKRRQPFSSWTCSRRSSAGILKSPVLPRA